MAQGITGYGLHALLSDGLLYQLFLFSQDWGNFMVAAAIVYAVARRIFFPPPRLQGLALSSRIDAFIILGMIFALVTTALFVLGLQDSSGAGLFFAYHLTQPLHTSLSPEGVQLAYQGFWWAHCVGAVQFSRLLAFFQASALAVGMGNHVLQEQA